MFSLIGQQPIAELDTHDLLEVTQRIKDRGTMDVALRVQNYLSTIMWGAKRARQITQNPALDLAGTGICAFVLGVSPGGPGALACAVVGGAVGGKVLCDGGGKAGEIFGDFLYGEVSE